MKKESCDDEDTEVKDKEKGDDESDDDLDGKSSDNKELSFMQKKGMKSGEKMKKKCSGDAEMPDKKCSKCKKMKKKCSGDVKKEADEFLNSLAKSYQTSGFQKHSSGLHEDMLILAPETNPKPGDVGFAPDTRIGSMVTPELVESVNSLLKRIADLEKQLEK